MQTTSQQPTSRNQDYAIPRERMFERLRDHYQICDGRVLEAMRTVPRHAFVPEALQGRAYGDHALPISCSQTISQPYIVARMTELLEINAESRVLEIGAGSGYQTAGGVRWLVSAPANVSQPGECDTGLDEMCRVRGI